MNREISSGKDGLVRQKMFPLWPYNKSLIVQACSVKMAKNWPRSLKWLFY